MALNAMNTLPRIVHDFNGLLEQSSMLDSPRAMKVIDPGETSMLDGRLPRINASREYVHLVADCPIDLGSGVESKEWNQHADWITPIDIGLHCCHMDKELQGSDKNLEHFRERHRVDGEGEMGQTSWTMTVEPTFVMFEVFVPPSCMLMAVVDWLIELDVKIGGDIVLQDGFSEGRFEIELEDVDDNLLVITLEHLQSCERESCLAKSDNEQRPHELNFFLEKLNSSEVIKALQECLQKLKLDVKIIYNNGTTLDILPKGAGKGQVLAYFVRKFKANGRIPLNLLVCGDSGNYVEIFTILEVYNVMVSNAQEELLQWHAENVKHNPNIIHSSERCASGIIQVIGKLYMGPNVSPRDIKDFEKCRVEVFNPGYEVVFYLFYEQRRRAEVEKSDKNLQNLKSSFYPLGTFVHPYGTVRPMNKCTNTNMMERLYGDKQGKGYQIWLDCISISQIGLDSWLVKFAKWKLTGEDRCRCLTTVLLTTKQAEEFFTWMHIHHIWLDDLEAKGEHKNNIHSYSWDHKIEVEKFREISLILDEIYALQLGCSDIYM
ncbi:hypothetical protein V6N12_057271 [Hibiscus sabdariffa]|uniref:Sucrose-phosphatase n=1 Tax=Hibiscus sabdariffa TaxID=183260 RepID=A0ABR2DBC9_9ROSI